MSQGTKLQLNKDSKCTNATLYGSLIGKLLYLCHTRSDIVFSVNMLSRFMTSPTKIQHMAAKQVLRYLAGTRDLGIQYNSNIQLKLEGFVGSDWCGDV